MSRCEKCGTTEINQAAQALMLLLDNSTVFPSAIELGEE